MKKLFLLGLAVILFTACNKQETRYTQNSPEIETVKKLISNYDNQAYDTSLYADTAKVYFNTKNPIPLSELLAYHKANDANYSSRGFSKEDQEYEMVLTDDGETWVNCWLTWEATMAGNEKEIVMPVHLTYQFIDGKIVREVGLWDPTAVVLALQQIEADNNLPADEKVINTTIQAITKAWNSNDKAVMASLMTDNFVRTENGNVLCKSSAEYGDKLMDLYHTSFPDFKVTLDKVQTMANNKVYLNWTCTGTNTAEFAGNPATGKKIKTHGFSVWSFNKDGKAIQEDAYYDNLIVFHQLGLTPPKAN